MPSFRVTMTIGRLRAGTHAEHVLPAAAEAAAELTTVEASSVNVVARSARITVRFTAEGANEAQRIALHVADGTARLAEVPSWVLTERVGGRWFRR